MKLPGFLTSLERHLKSLTQGAARSPLSNALSASSKQEAAVLIPFCLSKSHSSSEKDDEDALCLLFTLRSESLSSHKGQVSFPGGKKDSGDDSLTATALRETHEEIGIPSKDIRVLGTLYPSLPDRTGRIQVTPIVGFYSPPPSPSSNTFHPSTSLCKNPDEVSLIFSVPWSQLVETRGLKVQQFRQGAIQVPYWDVSVDQETGIGRVISEDFASVSCGLQPNGTLRIWGLTAFILDLLMEHVASIGGGRSASRL